MPYDVFISHSSIDKTVADAAVAVLERSRIRCWVAPRDIMPGADWGASILQGIRSSRLMLVIFSSHANASDQVKREVERAVHQGIPILPLRIENIMPTGSMEFFLSTPHWLDALSSPLESHLEQLARTVSLILYGTEQVPVQAPAPAWTPTPAASYSDPGQAPQWAPPATATPQIPQWTPGAVPVTPKQPFPLWLIAVIFGGVVFLGGAVYAARSFASSGGFSIFEPAGPKITSISFFESGFTPAPKPKRIYATRFANIGTRYITYEVSLQYPASKEESKAVLESRWTKPDGTPETKQEQLLVLPAGSTTGTWTYGWGTKEGGYFHPGTYTVDFYLADKKAGSSKFEVYQGEAAPSGYIQSLDATVTSVLFYESANTGVTKEQRHYQTQFSNATTRYLHWEMNLSFPRPASHTVFTIHELWRKPDGNLEREGDVSTYIEPFWDHSYHNSSGWGSPNGGSWALGTYHVDFYVDKQRVATSTFDIVP